MTDQNPIEEFEAELATEILKVSEHVHALLDGPDGRGQLDGTFETQQVTLTLPKALIHLAEFLAVMERGDKASSLEFWQYVSGVGHDDPTPRRNMTKMRRAYLERMLGNDLQFELHMLATGGLDLTGKSKDTKE